MCVHALVYLRLLVGPRAGQSHNLKTPTGTLTNAEMNLSVNQWVSTCSSIKTLL